MRHNSLHRFNLVPIPIIALLFIFGFALAGCTKIQSDPFTKLSTSMQQVRSGTDQAATQIGAWSQDRTANQIATITPEESQKFIRDIKLEYNPQNNSNVFDPAGVMSKKDPLYVKIDKFRQGIYAFNTGIVDYMTAMQTLAAPSLINTDTFNKMQSDLNGNLNQSATILGINLPDLAVGSSKIDEFALLSTGLSEAFRGYLEQRRKSELINLIKANQEQIIVASELGKKAVVNLWQALKTEYDNRYSTLGYDASGYGQNRKPDNSIKKDTRIKAANDLIALTKAYSAELQALDALYKAYDDLPKAHLELATNLEKPETTLVAIQDIYSEGQRLYTAYAALSTTTKSASK